MTDHLLWSNDIENRFSPTSLSHVAEGSGYIATAVISSVTTNSGFRLSLWDAYKDLREKLLDGNSDLLPISTTTQRNALSGIVDGTLIYNDTTGRVEECDSDSWSSSAGSSALSDAAYGNMYENNSSGSAMDSTNKTWVTATAGIVDANGLVTVVEDAVDGDYFLIGTDGDGDYAIIVDTKQTNSGNNDTTLTIEIDEDDTILTKDEVDTSSTKPTSLSATGILALVAGNKLRVHMVSSTPADVVKSFHTHFYIHRLS